ncbi:phosphatase PAP2 family protein [Streptomyces fuscigenes]|uniref:phosphatase PAP2 family protein n=1 Tax=Streptomyces fuscigenes TaxID=1528880 RepID=UPI001F40F7B6|nr:phosphatase PAP2 family protein [Streptomyces fuscigenes]MCF3961461.1 phosphatase PAP2 family protein [Streptomyces fuscigenes]
MSYAVSSAHRTGAHPRLRWWIEILLLAVVYAAYSAGRLLARGDIPGAVRHGLAILHIEQHLRIDPERLLNGVFTRSAVLGVPADFVYASLHYLVTPAVLLWLYLRRPGHYRRARTWLMLSTMIGLIGFTLLPTAPPRLLGPASGFVDTMARYSSYGWWGGEASAPRGLGSITNQYAAMPSLHVGWALWCGVMLWRHARTPLVRWLGAAYPVVVALVVIGTANHYLLDAVAGVTVMAVGALLTDPLRTAVGRILRRPPERSATRPGARGGVIVGGGCKTSPGERIPGQRTRTGSSSAGAKRGARRGAAADAGGTTAAAG